MAIQSKSYNENMEFFKKFQNLALRTYPDLGTTKANLIHMSMGMNTEMNELEDAFTKKDIVNVSEELADIMWYFACYIYIRNSDASYTDKCFDYHDITCTMDEFRIEGGCPDRSKLAGRIANFFTKKHNTKKHIKLLYYNISLLQDPIKKLFVYNKSYDREMEFDLLLKILISVKSIYYVNGLDFEKSLMNIIDKLKKRFPDKFTEHMAINRNLEAERKELEK